MDRLTNKESAGYNLIKMQDKWCDDYCNEHSEQIIQTCRDCAINEAIQKLAYYEDLEENNELIKLPYSLSTEMVYFLDTDGEIYELDYKNLSIKLMPYDNKIMYTIDFCEFYIEDISKTVFLTRDEAELKLKEME